jgi:four helix bundle protein
MQSYKELTVWQKSMDLVVLIYNLTRTFPDEEKFGLVSQMRRAAVSIPSNIAEGFGRRNKKDNARFS